MPNTMISACLPYPAFNLVAVIFSPSLRLKRKYKHSKKASSTFLSKRFHLCGLHILKALCALGDSVNAGCHFTLISMLCDLKIRGRLRDQLRRQNKRYVRVFIFFPSSKVTVRPVRAV